MKKLLILLSLLIFSIVSFTDTHFKIEADQVGVTLFINDEEGPVYTGRPIEIILPKGFYVMEFKKENEDGSYWYYRHEQRVLSFDMIQLLDIKLEKKYTEEYYFKKATTINEIESYLREYPNGKYVNELSKKKINTKAGIITGIKSNLVRVSGGTFKMGKDSYYEEKEITVSSFVIGKYEVTQKEYQAVIGNTPSYFKGDNLPVEKVTWFDAINFCNELSELEGLEPAYNRTGELLDRYGNVTIDTTKVEGYRLPTEAEWEFAARGGNSSKGYKYSGSDSCESVSWYWQNSGDEYLTGYWELDKIMLNNGRTHKVGTKQSNELGIYDMSGNVLEWVQDGYVDDDKSKYKNRSSINPYMAEMAMKRFARGGSWYLQAYYSAVASRDYSIPSSSYDGLGFRICRSTF